MSERPASHAGSWYEAAPAALRAQLSAWLDEAAPRAQRRGRFAVGPHAGLRFCGAVLAHTYAGLAAVDRVVLLGPSHFQYFRGLRTTAFGALATPLGAVAVDTAAVRRLRDAGVGVLDEAADVKEHSWEMHLPFLRVVNPRAAVVPVLFGAASATRAGVGAASFDVLAELAADPRTAFVVSTDFCHWGEYFDFVPFAADAPLVYKAIEALDREGMAAAATGSAAAWRRYIDATGNTVCGEKPLGLLLALAEANGRPLALDWRAYAQSSKARSRRDSSVSYAAAVAE